MSTMLDLDLQEQIKAGHADAFRVHRYGAEINGEFVPERTVLAEAAYSVLMERAVVDDVDERNQNALTEVQLLELLFPKLKGADPRDRANLDEVEEGVYKMVLRDIGSITSPSERGAVQKRLAGDEPPYVLVRADDFWRGAAFTETAVYLTRNEKLLDRDYIPPLAKEVAKAQEKMARNLALVGNRIPALNRKMHRKLEATQKTSAEQSRATLGALMPAAATDTTPTPSEDSAS